MKRNLLKRMVFAALVAGSLAAWQPLSEAAVQVNPVAGMRPDFIKGADVSMLPEMEAAGAKFYDVDGTQLDEMQIMKNHGVNWVRFRVWNNPTQGGGNIDAKRALALTKRAHALGLKVLIDFHYSDWWADPAHQATPAAWAGHSAARLEQDVYNYTRDTLKMFQQAGEQPEMVQVGNEIKNGMLWPTGQLPAKDGGQELCRLIASGERAVRDTDKKIQIMIHLPDGGDNALFRSFFDMLKTHAADDYDVIGLSYYPFWHGTLDAMQKNINDVSQRYGKDVVIAETAFGYTNQDFDGTPNCYGSEQERIGGFKSSVQGQATGLRAVMERLAQVPNGRGLGLFYWEPDWYAVRGAGVSNSEGDQWENLAMFDKDGKALESWDVFNKVSDASQPVVPVTVEYVETQAATGGMEAPIALPPLARVVFSDEHAEMLPVTWATPAPVYHAQGKYTLRVSTQGGGGQSKYELFCEVNGKRQTAGIKDTKWNEWHTVEIKDIEVKGGTATIGVTMQAKPGTWGSLDNFEFIKQ